MFSGDGFMSIVYRKEDKTITLHTAHTSYQMKEGPGGFLMHTYYGPRITGDADQSYAMSWMDRGFSGNPHDAGKDRGISADVMPLEYPCEGNGDYRYTAFGVRRKDSASGCDLRMKGFEILPGKYQLEGLPSVHAKTKEKKGKSHQQTLRVTLEDEGTGICVELFYGVLEEADTITRSAKITNQGSSPLVLQNAASTSLDYIGGMWDLIHFAGRHCGERTPERREIGHEEILIGSRRGASGHQNNPFVILAEREAAEDHGACVGISLLYSGSFSCVAGMDQFGTVRLTSGIMPERFDYLLEKNESFQTPEAAMIFTDRGLTDLSHRMHTLVREHICRGPWALRRRPVLINSWESMGMNFDRNKLLEFAQQAAALGVEMMVLDDGWFGERDDDYKGLGDWIANERKIGGSIGSLAEEIRTMGMRFGLWIEPEMVSENSSLYRNHPDWAFTIPGKKPVRGRYQLVLDFSREEVVDTVFDRIAAVLDECKADYVKMDMNRSLSDVRTMTAGEQSQGKTLYRYMLGVYRFMEKLLQRYPNILLEGCCGGGGRFDAGMLFYSPQIWCSDDSDAIERLEIQYGTSFGYPLSTIGAHVSAVPNGATRRVVPFSTRGIVALTGGFGFELNLNELSDEEKALVSRQVKEYKQYAELIIGGLYYRLTDVVANREEAAWMIVAPDRSEALVSIVCIHYRPNAPQRFVRLKGLEDNRIYRDIKNGKEYSGAGLRFQGIPLFSMEEDYEGWQLHLKRVE